MYLVIAKTRFKNLVSAILFKIVKLICPHKLRLCNVICVAYRVVYKVVVSYILRVMWKRVVIIAFTKLQR